MRSRSQIEGDHRGYELLTLEVLLDIRQLLKKEKGRRQKETKPPPPTPKPVGRPRKKS